MINELAIKNYKSVLSAKIPLTRLTVLIGENGAGKSNILESLVLAAAAASNKLDTEYLNARGVRLTSPRLMRSAFDASTKNKPIEIEIKTINPFTREASESFRFLLSHNDSSPTDQWTLDPKSEFPMFGTDNFLKSLWERTYSTEPPASAIKEFRKIGMLLEDAQKSSTKNSGKKHTVTAEVSKPVAHILGTIIGKFTFERFTVYSPNLETLRNHLTIPPTSPLGPKGEGLLATLAYMQNKEADRYQDILESLELLSWYKSVKTIGKGNAINSIETSRLEILDKFIRSRGLFLSELSVNEGFFYILFYMTLVCSKGTPSMFAIENIETALNPRLCEVIVNRIYELAKKYNKQIIITTHNPAVLDALNLDDLEQSLVIIRRTADGHTLGNRYMKPQQPISPNSLKLSEAFLRGHIGALPKGF